jgi:hypothetical protein
MLGKTEKPCISGKTLMLLAAMEMHEIMQDEKYDSASCSDNTVMLLT